MRRLLIASLVLAVGAVAGAGACGFPDVAFSEDPETGASGDGSVADGPGNTTAEGGDAKADSSQNPEGGQILIDGSSPDALIAKDAGMAIDASGCAANDCDCDKDGVANTLKAGCSGPVTDCDDSDPRAHPGQKFLEDPAVPPLFGDWDCSGTPEPLYKTNVSCAGLTLGLGCANIFGFEDSPLCGQTGSFIQCTGSVLDLGCKVGTRDMRKQPCK